MARKNKKIEFYKVDLFTMEGEPSDVSFEDVITNPDILERTMPIKGKDIELRILERTENYIVGMVETSRDSNVPPKKHKRNRTFTRIGLNVDEGLAYGNVFLYDLHRQVMLYEVNKFGCFLDHFALFIYAALREADSTLFRQFRIRFGAILTRDEYHRIMNFGFHKSIEVEIAHPERIADDFEHNNNALYNAIEDGRQMGSTKVFSKFEVEGRPNRRQGLSNTSIREILDSAGQLLQGRNRGNLKKIVVSGYEDGVRRLRKIDLIADRYIKSITLEEPREHTNLMATQRRERIVELYTNCTADLDAIFG